MSVSYWWFCLGNGFAQIYEKINPFMSDTIKMEYFNPPFGELILASFENTLWLVLLSAARKNKDEAPQDD